MAYGDTITEEDIIEMIEQCENGDRFRVVPKDEVIEKSQLSQDKKISETLSEGEKKESIFMRVILFLKRLFS